MEQPDKPQMTTIASRPVKVLHKPQGDILIACRTADGEDVHVPLSALCTLLLPELVRQIRTISGTRL